MFKDYNYSISPCHYIRWVRLLTELEHRIQYGLFSSLSKLYLQVYVHAKLSLEDMLNISVALE